MQETENVLMEVMKDTAVLLLPTLRRMYRLGIIGFYPDSSTGEVYQMGRRDFLEAFDKYTVHAFPAEYGGYTHRAVAEYNGVKFFCLLDEEVWDEDLSAFKG